MALQEVWRLDCPGRVTVRRLEDGSLQTTCWVEEPTNLVLNGDWAAGRVDWAVSPATSSWDVVDGSARVAVGADTALVQLYQGGISLTPGASYVLRFRARGSVARALEVAVHQHGSPYTKYGLTGTVQLTQEWQPFTLEFVAAGMTAPVTDGRLRFTLRQAKAGEELWLDDVRLEAVQ